MRTMIAGCVATLMILAVGAGAGIEHTILHGVEVGKVDVWVGPGEPQDPPDLSDVPEQLRSSVHAFLQSSLSEQMRSRLREQLQSSVESQLREAGIPITPGAPAQLHVRVEVFARPDACFATIESALVEDALLVRNGLRVPAQSWQSVSSPSSNTVDGCVGLIADDVERTVSEFIETYGAMNPTAD
jgi:hypothetical protein